jgi:hypothetical protein
MKFIFEHSMHHIYTVFDTTDETVSDDYFGPVIDITSTAPVGSTDSV